jgi:hypothetical protein
MERGKHRKESGEENEGKGKGKQKEQQRDYLHLVSITHSTIGIQYTANDSDERGDQKMKIRNKKR